MSSSDHSNFRFPIYLKVDSAKEYTWLKTLFDNTLSGDPNGHFLQVNFEHLQYWQQVIDSPINKSEVELPPPTARRAPRKQKAKKLSREDKKNPLICNEHPTYTGSRVPRKDCDGCWDVYKRLHPMDYKTKRIAFERKMKAD